MQALDVVVLPDFREAEEHIVSGGNPFGRINNAALRGGDNVRTGHGNHGHSHFLERLGRHAWRGAELDLADFLQRSVMLLEPAEGFGTHGHDQIRLHIGLENLLVVCFEQLLALAFPDPRHDGSLVKADAKTGRGRGKEHAGRMLAGPVVRPGLAAVDDALIHGIKNFKRLDHSAFGQEFDLDLPAGQLFNAFGHAIHNLVVQARRALRGLDLQFVLGGMRHPPPAQEASHYRKSKQFPHAFLLVCTIAEMSKTRFDTPYRIGTLKVPKRSICPRVSRGPCHTGKQRDSALLRSGSSS